MACTAARMFAYNATLCACDPGYYLSNSTTCLSLATAGAGTTFADWQVGTVGASRNQSLYFLAPVLSLDAVRRLTQSQAVLLVTALVTLLSWLAFCAAARFAGRDPTGNKKLFEARFWVSRLDCIFDTQHWADDQQVLRKRKTELGGMCSVATLILFIGLVTVLLYQAIKRRNIEVHRVKPANAPDLLSFVNDIEFHITTISSMSCAQLVAPSTIAMGTPGFMDFRVLPLSTLLTYSCQNTSLGPSISLKCNGCRIPPRDHYVSWQFIDLLRQPASAVGFQFNLTTKQNGDNEHVNFVSGTINSDNYGDDKLKTFRGRDSNVLKIQLFPQIYNNLHNLKLLQPLLQDFTPGSTFSDVSSLNASLQNPTDGVINTTLYISYLSDYIVEISNENVLGPVSILASIGGLYAFSVAIFLCLMAQCEGRIKKLREDFSVLLVLFRRELSFEESLSMWEVMWAADFDEDAIRNLEENCLEPLLIDMKNDLLCEVKEEHRVNSYVRRKSKSRISHRRNGEVRWACKHGTKLSTRNPLCGLSGATIWARHQQMPHLSTNVLVKNGDDELPIFCVAAILIINRHKIIRGTHSIDDAIKMFNDNLLKINVKRCVRMAVKLRKKYWHKSIKGGSE